MANDPLIARIFDEASFDGGEPIKGHYNDLTGAKPPTSGIERQRDELMVWFTTPSNHLKMDVNRVSGDELTLPETNSKKPLKTGLPKRNFHLPTIARGELLVSGRVGFILCDLNMLPRNGKQQQGSEEELSKGREN